MVQVGDSFKVLSDSVAETITIVLNRSLFALADDAWKGAIKEAIACAIDENKRMLGDKLLDEVERQINRFGRDVAYAAIQKYFRDKGI